MQTFPISKSLQRLGNIAIFGLKMKYVTIKDIAASLSLSVSTVSRALSGDKNIRDETRAKVIAAAEEMGYRHNAAAASLKTGRTSTVGVIVPEMWSEYTIQVIRGIQSILYPYGVKVIIADSNEDPAQEKENIMMMERFMVDGLIVGLCSYLHNMDEFRRLQNDNLPLAFFGRIPHGLEVSQVLVDDYAKSFFIVEKLILSGRRKICHIHGPERVYNAVERARGYRDALAKYNIPFESSLQIYSRITRNDGANAVDQLIDSGTDFDAIFAFTEAQAIGALGRLRQRGLRVPEDVAVSCFSGSVLSEVVTPQLTSVEPPMFEIGQTLAQLLIEQIKNPSAGPRTVVLNAEIKMRESTGDNSNL